MIVVSYSLILYGKVFKWNREKRVKHTRNDSEAAKPKGQANFSHLEILSIFFFYTEQVESFHFRESKYRFIIKKFIQFFPS